MRKSATFQWLFHKSMQSFTCYSLSALLGVVVLSDAVEATKNTESQIGQQEKLISQEAIRVAAKRAYLDSLSEEIARKVSDNAKIASFLSRIAQSPATKPQNTNSPPNEAEAKVKALIAKALQLQNEALQLQEKPSAANRRHIPTNFSTL